MINIEDKYEMGLKLYESIDFNEGNLNLEVPDTKLEKLELILYALEHRSAGFEQFNNKVAKMKKVVTYFIMTDDEDIKNKSRVEQIISEIEFFALNYAELLYNEDQKTTELSEQKII